MATENPIPAEVIPTRKFTLKKAGKEDYWEFDNLYEPAEILVTRARQLFGAEEGEMGMTHIANAYDGVQTFRKGNSRYLLQYNQGYDASMVRTSLKPGDNDRPQGSMETFLISLDEENNTADLYYSSLQFENGKMTHRTLSSKQGGQDDQAAIDAIGQLIERVDGEFFSDY